MLRIKGPSQPSIPSSPPPTPDPTKAEAGVSPAVPEAENVTPIDPSGASGKPAKFSADKVDPSIARYMGPELGPFECQACEHFNQDGSCSVVSGPIDPQGVCILFTHPDSEPSAPPDDGTTPPPPATGAPAGGPESGPSPDELAKIGL